MYSGVMVLECYGINVGEQGEFINICNNLDSILSNLNPYIIWYELQH